mmetsp:Transcript_248/g.379  ORF Transcript_248/g.379 Transcript_248/m.379 type:complete len:262 (-) Transcript_248:74-859(-)
MIRLRRTIPNISRKQGLVFMCFLMLFSTIIVQEAAAASFLAVVQRPISRRMTNQPPWIIASSSTPPSSSSLLLLAASTHASNDDYALLQERVQQMRLIACLERDMERPPSTALTAKQFCTALLESLQNPHAGFRTLLRCSTDRWKTALYRAVGAPSRASPEQVASALASAVVRPNQYYRLLVQQPQSKFDFPKGEPLDFYDGTCWMECRLFSSSSEHPQGGAAMLGFALVQDEAGAWMLDDLIWHDLQDQPRSGWQEQTWR